jgi:hypothetical protein
MISPITTKATGRNHFSTKACLMSGGAAGTFLIGDELRFEDTFFMGDVLFGRAAGDTLS